MTQSQKNIILLLFTLKTTLNLAAYLLHIIIFFSHNIGCWSIMRRRLNNSFLKINVHIHVLILLLNTRCNSEVHIGSLADSQKSSL